jgi:hypothetical protein
VLTVIIAKQLKHLHISTPVARSVTNLDARQLWDLFGVFSRAEVLVTDCDGEYDCQLHFE